MPASAAWACSRRTVLALAAAALAWSAPALAQYKVVPGFAQPAPRGPEAALGVVIYNHGVRGREDQARFPVPDYVRVLAHRGWDVLKIERDGAQERGWAVSGPRHVAFTREEAARARAQGYKRVVFAGQSYGGWIALLAAAEEPAYGVIATAPGRTGDSGSNRGTGRWANDVADLYPLLRRTRAERLVLVTPRDDELFPAERGTESRQALSERGTPFLLVDERTGVSGHAAAASAEFLGRFGRCLAAFLNPEHAPSANENRCGENALPGEPTPLPGLARVNAFVPAPADGEDLKFFAGVWTGWWANGQPTAIALVGSAPADLRIEYFWGPGAFLDTRPGRQTRAVRLEDGTLVSEQRNIRITLKRRPDGRADARYERMDNEVWITGILAKQE